MKTLGKLRSIRDEELELMLSWRNNPNVRANMYTRHEISLEEHISWWARTSKRDDQQYFMYESDGSPIGIVNFVAIDRQNGNCSWGFYASPQAPKGTGSRMEFLALDHVFFDLQLHKLHGEVLAFNKPVIRLHQKFGFKIEGILREHHRIDDGYVDICRIGLLAHEWTEIRGELLGKLLPKE